MHKITQSIKQNKTYLISLIISITAALIIGGILMAVTGFNPFESRLPDEWPPVLPCWQEASSRGSDEKIRFLHKQHEAYGVCRGNR